jgi:hypothetical protein
MTKCRPEVADVFREHGEEFLTRQGRSLSTEQRQALGAIMRCRTAALGGHKLRCGSCGHEEISYNSCRNRHCPKCQASGQAEWLDREAEYLLPVEYFHVVFTLPAALGPLALQNKREIYGALFRAAAETLSTIARDPKHLGAEIGFLMVLHTWGQTIHHHPHVHCVVPGGGLSPDGTRWIACRKGFFLPVRVLSRLFRKKFLHLLKRLYAKGKLSLTGSVATLRGPAAWRELIDSLRHTAWVVYSKKPFGGPRQTLKYLARYTHRVAISNRRIVSLDGGRVRFRWKDYAHESKQRVMTLDPQEFIRRFLMHILPKGFVRIRHYGFLSNCARKEKLPVVKRAIADSEHLPPAHEETNSPDLESSESSNPSSGERPCPRCKEGRLVVVGELPAQPEPQIQFADSS